jgi:hypothetical protein
MNNTSFHAKIRFRQRNIQEDTVCLLIKHGETTPAPGGANRISLSTRRAGVVIGELKKTIHWLEKASRVVLIEKDGIILTGYQKRT